MISNEKEEWSDQIIARFYERCKHLKDENGNPIDILTFVPRGAMTADKIRSLSLKRLLYLVESEGYGK